MINNAPTPMLLAWNTVLIVILIVLAVLLTVFIVLSIIGRKMQKKQADNEAAMKQSAQVMSMLIIDKKRMKLNEAGLPSIVIEQTPKYMRRAKLPIAKVRVGPKMMNLICDEKIFPLLPIKKEVKAVVSGIYIMDIKHSRNNLEAPSKTKVGKLAKLRMKAQKALDDNKK